jgi:hypothetical protein
MNIQISDIGHMIQLAIAPVFLLTGVATKLTVLTNRLARIIDRTRVLEDRLRIAANDEYTRSHLINYAITSSTVCGFLVCLVIAMLFVGDSANIKLDKYIAASFVMAVFGLIFSFGFFLREIFISSRFMRIRHDASLVPGERRTY